MYSKGKNLQQQSQQPQQILPIEVQAKEKLNIYVYEFLVHIGAKNTAQTFLSEIRWEKQVQIGEAPGFLYSWWNVFWDLYCAAAPERRDQFDPSNEAKVFHEYQIPNDMMMNPNIQMMNHNNYFNVPGAQGQNNPMMNPGQQFQRFNSPGGQRPIRMPLDFNPNNNMNPGGPNPMTPDQSRIQAGMSPISRLTPPGNRMQPGLGMQGQVPPNQMNFNGAPTPQQIRGPPNQAPTPGLQNAQQMPNGPMSPMSMSMQQQQQPRWNQGPGNNQIGPPQQPGQPQQQPGQGLPPPPPPGMNYGQASSPIPYSNVQMGGHHGPGTPNLISSPQDANGEFNNLMKNVPVQFQDQNMGHMVQMNHDMSMNNEIIDSIKNSPLPNLQVNRHQGEEHVGNPMNEITYNNFGDQPLF